MELFLETARQVSVTVLPILGVIVLIVLIDLLVNLIKTLKNTNNFLNKTQGTVDLVDESIKKVQAPLDSVVKVSHTVDVAHDATIKGLGEAKDFIVKNADNLKEKIAEFTAKNEKEDELMESNPDNTIGGQL